MELKTNAFRARFAPEANNFVSLVNLATGDDYIKAAPRGPLVELYALADGEKKKLLPGVPGMSAGAGFLEISYTEFGGLPIGMTVRCTAENDRLCPDGEPQCGGCCGGTDAAHRRRLSGRGLRR